MYEVKMFAVTCSGEWPKRAVCISAGLLLLLLLFSSTLRPPSSILVYTLIVHNAILDSRMIPSVMSPGFTFDAAVAF